MEAIFILTSNTPNPQKDQQIFTIFVYPNVQFLPIATAPDLKTNTVLSSKKIIQSCSTYRLQLQHHKPPMQLEMGLPNKQQHLHLAQEGPQIHDLQSVTFL